MHPCTTQLAILAKPFVDAVEVTDDWIAIQPVRPLGDDIIFDLVSAARDPESSDDYELATKLDEALVRDCGERWIRDAIEAVVSPSQNAALEFIYNLKLEIVRQLALRSSVFYLLDPWSQHVLYCPVPLRMGTSQRDSLVKVLYDVGQKQRASQPLPVRVG